MATQTLEMKLFPPQSIELRLSLFAQKLEVLCEEYEELKEDFQKQQEVPRGWLTPREMENLCPFMSRSTLSKIINKYPDFFEGHHTKRGNTIYVNPEKVIEFILYPTTPDAEMPKVKSAFFKQRPHIPFLQDMENRINEKRKKQETLF